MTVQPPKAQASKAQVSSAAMHEADRTAMWQPREASVADAVAQYSRFVAAMKVALPVAAGFLLLLVVMLPQFRADDERFRIGMSLIKGDGTDNLSMTNARYYGTDDKGQPYSVTAEGVRQHANEDRSIDLVTPKAEISLTNGTYMSAEASIGIYDRDNQKLDLSGAVTVSRDKDGQLHTSEAVVMLKDGTASGRAPVTGEGSFGKMEADGGFDLSDRGRIVHFHGPARLTLNPDKKPKPAATTETTSSPKAAPKP